MAIGDVTLASSIGGCRCSKFACTATARNWAGAMFYQFVSNFSSPPSNVIYFKQYSWSYLKITGGPPSNRDPWRPWVVTTNYNTAAGPSYGQAIQTTSNPDNLTVYPTSGLPSVGPYPLFLSQMSVPGAYIWRAENGKDPFVLVSFTPGATYSITLDQPGPIIWNNIDFDLREVRRYVQTWSGEHIEAEFEAVIRQYLDATSGPFASETYRITRYDALPIVDVVTSSLWTASGHACRQIVRVSYGQDGFNDAAYRGYGVLRKCTVFQPGSHSITTHANTQFLVPGVASAIFIPAPVGGGGVHEGGGQTLPGFYGPGHVSAAYYLGPPTACENVSMSCAGGSIEIPVPTTNASRGWREDTVCAP